MLQVCLWFWDQLLNFDQNKQIMDKINKDLEQRIIELVKANKPIEAVSLVHDELELGLKESKDLVDKYRQIDK